MRSWGIAAVLVVQAACTIVFLWDLLSSLFGLRSQPMNWQLREMMELGAALGLLLGLGMSGAMLVRARQRAMRVEQALQVASGAFSDLLDQKFTEWGLTRAERDVALFAIKGFSLGEIAEMRSTSEGTVKAQTNAIYRKAGVSGRPQLLSVFIEDLMAVSLVPGPQAPRSV